MAFAPLRHRTMADYCSTVRWHNSQSKPEIHYTEMPTVPDRAGLSRIYVSCPVSCMEVLNSVDCPAFPKKTRPKSRTEELYIKDNETRNKFSLS